MNDELIWRLQRFLITVELVFDHDWDFTQNLILNEDFISNNGTFLDPFPGEHFAGGAGDNWANRSSFLAAYRELKAFAISEGLYDPDEEHWNQ